MTNTASQPGSTSTLELKGVRKSFGTLPVLDGVDLRLENGGIVSLLGPSGCGKTTLLRVIAGLERPESGVIRLGDRILTSSDIFVPPERRRIGMVFQDWALFPHLTVAENVAFGLDRQERQSGRVEEALGLVDLEHLAHRGPATLSGGQQQRVALARALAPRPDLLLLDEPFSNLDAFLRAQVRADVRRLLRDLQMPALFVTHDQEEAFVVGDEVAVLWHGRIIQQASPALLYSVPLTPWLAGFVGDANLLPGRAEGHTAQTPIGSVPLADRHHGPVEVLLRPEALVLESGAGGTIDIVEFYGHDTAYRVRLASGELVKVRAMAAPCFQEGQEVRVTYAGTDTVAYPTAEASSPEE